MSGVFQCITQAFFKDQPGEAFPGKAFLGFGDDAFRNIEPDVSGGEVCKISLSKSLCFNISFYRPKLVVVSDDKIQFIGEQSEIGARKISSGQSGGPGEIIHRPTDPQIQVMKG